MTGRSACSQSKQVTSSSRSTIGVRRKTRFPGAFEDGLAAVRDVFARIAEFGGDNKRVGVAGDSAGGNLAAAVAIAWRDAGIHLAAQLLVYPVTDVAGNYADAKENARFPSHTENAEGYFLSRAVMEWFARHYLGDPKQGDDWRVSPYARKALLGSRRRSFARRGSIPCETRAKPTSMRFKPRAYQPSAIRARA
jgi:acetyl esterase/lipase